MFDSEVTWSYASLRDFFAVNVIASVSSEHDLRSCTPDLNTHYQMNPRKHTCTHIQFVSEINCYRDYRSNTPDELSFLAQSQVVSNENASPSTDQFLASLHSFSPVLSMAVNLQEKREL